VTWRWGVQDGSGQDYAVREIQPPRNFAELQRGKVLETDHWTFSGFRTLQGFDLLRVTDPKGQQAWLQFAPVQRQAPQVAWSFGATNGTTSAWGG
jgi:hypothetical protein